MIRRSIYLHIGTHKTGTSSIQSTLAHNADILFRAGYLYPEKGRLGELGHHAVSHEFFHGLHFTEHKGELSAVLDEFDRSGLPNLILSSEDFFWYQREQVEEFIPHLPDDANVKVIVYLRRQDGLLQSAAIQNFKTMHRRDHIDNWPQFDGHVGRGKYATYLQPWADAIGVKNVIVRPFERSQLLDGDLLKDFLDAVGIPYLSGSLKPHQDENISPGDKTLALIQKIFEAVPEVAEDPSYPTVGYQRQLLKQILYYGKYYFENEKKYNIITPEIHQSLVEKFQDENEQVAHQYLGRSKLFIEPYKIRPVTPLSEVHLSEAEIIQALVFAGYRLKALDGKQNAVTVQPQEQSQEPDDFACILEDISFSTAVGIVFKKLRHNLISAIGLK